jgi:glutamate synthase domain-containing protein 2/glutamate synthase domain-containing protein 1/glutamate synthase domain-containing protein 3
MPAERGEDLRMSTTEFGIRSGEFEAAGFDAAGEARGLYDPALAKDSCGVGFIADITGRKSHAIVQDALTIVRNLEHRGAVGADPRAGDGAGILVQIPHKFFAKKARELGFTLPEPGRYAVVVLFLPHDDNGLRQEIMDLYTEQSARAGMELLGWRDVPTDNSTLGESVKPTEPTHRQLFIGQGENDLSEDDFERRIYIMRKSISGLLYKRRGRNTALYYPVSSSCRTVIYKGMFLADQLPTYYPDLHDPDFESALALIHQRFSTNTFPTWSLAHPYRYIAHNGEINTLRGNLNWMAARQASARSPSFGEDIHKLWPISYEGQSDTACFDNALEFLVQGGYSLAHAVMMMIPEAWAGNQLMDAERRAFYEYNAALMEPWDGPAAIAFTDGRQIGATLDRNGLRPARYFVTRDDRIIMASEMGVLPIAEKDIVTKWRLQPGKMLLVDLEEGRLIPDEEIKATLARSNPYHEWLQRTQIILEDLPAAKSQPALSNLSLLDRQQTFGYTQEDIKILMTPMASTGDEPVGSMGNDTPISALSDRPKPLFTYFKQNFAQVTNPPIDPIREELVMSLVSIIGPRPNLFDLEGLSHLKRLEVRQPILTNTDLEKIRWISEVGDPHFKSVTLHAVWPAEHGAAGMRLAIAELCREAEEAVRDGVNIIIISDRAASAERIPIPSLLACAAVHHHLIRKGLRTSVGLVVESGEPREVHHFSCLAGYGAEAINPYLAFETLLSMQEEAVRKLDEKEVVKRYIKSVDKGLLKVMSKMGISTYQSYCGAQIFDAVGLKSEFVSEFFTGTATRIEGVGVEEIAEETVRRHRDAFGDAPIYRNALDVGGEYAYRVRGEDHVWTAPTVALLQHAVRGNSYERYRAFAEMVNEQSERLLTIRGLFRIRPAEEDGRATVPLEEVEPAKNIVRRFATGAMSFGSISREAHTTLAIAMNRIGGRSNTGEGGEEADRFKPLPNGDSMRSSIKQVASGRFGVTTEYLVNSDVMQIKMAQGAKPGEGGQLPGHKVDKTIARVRHSTPGVGLISPPPHHDIYSIEDLAQLIFDLKNVNPAGDVSVKLVSEVGVGTVAAGVSKARADHVTIAGYDGGTGASPLTSIKHAGSPWEIGLAETHQTLVAQRLRGRIAVQVDGGIRTGRDVIVGALLGADEFGFATAPLIAAGCIMMRKCHLNTCPVGVATQDPVLRRRFKGQPEHVINYFFFVAEEVRELMAEMGYRSFDEMIGQVQMLDQHRLLEHWKAKGLDFSRLFTKPHAPRGVNIYKCEPQDHRIDRILDRKLIAQAQAALDRGAPVEISSAIKNTNRTVGAMLSGEIAKRYGHAGLPDNTIHIRLAGTAGQSFGAWLAHGVTLDLEGDANDYVGKGLSGGRIIVRPPHDAGIVPEESIVVGNTVLYGAISGECYFRGVAGERFAVRNSGAVAVVEGAGDHCCEYMTGGVVVVLGGTGRNFAAGMSGGIAYVLDEDGTFPSRCNMAMVELEPVPDEEDINTRFYGHAGDLDGHGRVEVMSDMSRFDARRLYLFIARHARFAGSSRAAHILENWSEYLPKFRKVMPLEYRRALKEMAKDQTAAMQAAE